MNNYQTTISVSFVTSAKTFLNLGEHKSFFVSPLIPQFWTSGDVSAGFQSQRDSALFGKEF